MLTITIITVHPDLVEAYSQFGVFRAARDKKLAQISGLHLRDFAVDKHRSVDDRPFGGGDGMVMRPEPLSDALKSLPEKPYVLLTSPAGKPWTQADAGRLAMFGRPLAIVCGRFGGIDQRFIDRYVDEQFSIGDVVLSGGELPALIMTDSMVRLIPGVLGHAESAQRDSFTPAFGGGLEHPLYTRPPEFEGMRVPDVLMSGDHEKIAAWQQDESRRVTAVRRPDLIRKK